MVHSFLIIGQSNAAGRGLLNEALPIDPSHIYILKNGRFQAMYRPVCPDRVASGVCLAESFAERYVKENGVDVGLIPCADGGTTLDQWEPGSLLFDHAVAQCKLAQRTSKIVGVLWHQGESDTWPHQYTTYQRRFETMMNALRKELGLEDVPFLAGGLGDFLPQCVKYPELQDYDKVNDALERIAAENPMTGFVSAKGLECNPDHLHFSAKALHEFGLRYYEVFKAIRKDQPDLQAPAANLERSSMELL